MQMNKFPIQKFTTTKGTAFNVNLQGILAVAPNDGGIPSGDTYEGAGAVLVTSSGYYLPVKEKVDAATELWLSGLRNMAGTA